MPLEGKIKESSISYTYKFKTTILKIYANNGNTV